MSVFVHAQGLKTVHVVGECPLIEIQKAFLTRNNKVEAKINNKLFRTQSSAHPTK